MRIHEHNLNIMGSKFHQHVSNHLTALFIITMAPVFAWLWMKLGDRQPTIPQKFSLGLLFAGLSFIVILLPGYFGGTDALVNPLWLILSILMVVLGNYAYHQSDCLQRRNWRLQLSLRRR